MCFATIGLVAGLAGAAASAGGVGLSAEAQGANASYQAQVAKNNEVIEGYNAVSATQAGEGATQAEGMKQASRAGAIKAGIGANNIDVNSGSAKNVEASQSEEGELSTETVMHNALLQAYGYSVGAESDAAQAKLEESEAEQAPIEGALGATGSLLSRASSLYSPGGYGRTATATS